MWLDTLERIRVSTIKLETDYKEAVRQKEEAERAVEASFGRAEQLSMQMREKEVQADQLRFAIQGRDATIRELESAIAVLRSNIQHNLESTARIREELEQREGRQDSLESQIAERRARLDEVQAQLEQTRRSVEEKNQQAQQALRSAGTLAKELEELRGREAMKTADANQAKALRVRLWPLLLRRYWTGTRRCARSCAAWRSGWRPPGPTRPRPTARSGTPGRSGTE